MRVTVIFDNSGEKCVNKRCGGISPTKYAVQYTRQKTDGDAVDMETVKRFSSHHTRSSSRRLSVLIYIIIGLYCMIISDLVL